MFPLPPAGVVGFGYTGSLFFSGCNNPGTELLEAGLGGTAAWPHCSEGYHAAPVPFARQRYNKGSLQPGQGPLLKSHGWAPKPRVHGLTPTSAASCAEKPSVPIPSTSRGIAMGGGGAAQLQIQDGCARSAAFGQIEQKVSVVSAPCSSQLRRQVGHIPLAVATTNHRPCLLGNPVSRLASIRWAGSPMLRLSPPKPLSSQSIRARRVPSLRPGGSFAGARLLAPTTGKQPPHPAAAGPCRPAWGNRLAVHDLPVRWASSSTPGPGAGIGSLRR